MAWDSTELVSATMEEEGTSQEEEGESAEEEEEYQPLCHESNGPRSCNRWCAAHGCGHTGNSTGTWLVYLLRHGVRPRHAIPPKDNVEPMDIDP